MHTDRFMHPLFRFIPGLSVLQHNPEDPENRLNNFFLLFFITIRNLYIVSFLQLCLPGYTGHRTGCDSQFVQQVAAPAEVDCALAYP